jgi:hypothetical protein
MGIDPGLANTGIVICKRGKGNTLKLLYAEKFTTKTTDVERILLIRKRLHLLALEFNVSRVICETFEVRTWEKPKKYAVAMCKLVNGISEEFYQMSIPMMLSSPANKKGLTLDNIPDNIRSVILGRPKTHQEHILDAYIHVHYQVLKRGN